jgi:YD repeat-containing protein
MRENLAWLKKFIFAKFIFILYVSVSFKCRNGEKEMRQIYSLSKTLLILSLCFTCSLFSEHATDQFLERIMPKHRSLFDFMLNLDDLNQEDLPDNSLTDNFINFSETTGSTEQLSQPRLYGKKQSKVTVVDSEGNKTKYFYGKDRLLERVEKLSSSSLQQMAESFMWAQHSLTSKPKLLIRTVFDEDNTPRLCQTYSYDFNGNLEEEIVYGTFTGTKAGEIHLHNDGYPKVRSNCDKIVRSYSYTKDATYFDVLVCDPLSNYTHLRYKKDTNLLLARLTCEAKDIKKREFFTYDSNGSLISEIVDDGTTFVKENLQGVTERHIKHITPRLKDPRNTTSEIIAEYYLDLKTNQESLTKKTINTFSISGLLLKKEIVSADGLLSTLEEYAYNDAGKIIYSKDPEGRVMIFEYDLKGLLKMKKGPRDDVAQIFSYDNAGNLIEENETLSSGLSLKTKFKYDTLGRKIAVIDQQGNETQFTYDCLGRIVAVNMPSIRGDDSKIDSISRQYAYKKLVQEILEIDERGNETRKSYSASGKLLKVIYADDSRKKYCYDEKERLVSEVGPDGINIEHRYDCFDRKIYTSEEKSGDLFSTLVWKYNTFHELSYHGPTNEEIFFSYDNAGRKISSKEAIDKTSFRTTQFLYDAFDQVIEERQMLSDFSFIAKRFTHDKLNRVVTEACVDQDNKLYSSKSFTYDTDSNVQKISEMIADVLTTTITDYLPHGLPCKKIDANGNTTLIEFDNTFVNTLGQRVCRKTITNPQGVKVVEINNSLGLLESVERYEPTGQKTKQITFLYDAAGNLTRKLENIFSEEKQYHFLTAYSYDNMNRLVNLTEAFDTPEAKTTSFIYSIQNVNYLTIYPKGISLVKYYDRKGRAEFLQDDQNTINYNYFYDASNRIVKAINVLTTGKTLRSYNGLSQLTTETLESGLTFQYIYDLLGRLSKIVLPDNSQVQYNYSPVYLKSITKLDASGSVAYTYDVKQALKDNNFRTDDTDPFSINSAHDSQFDFLTNDQEFYKIDNFGLITQAGSTTYKYDDHGSRLEELDGDNVKLYSYDSLNRLIEVDTGNLVVKYTYDAFNRRIKKAIFKKSEENNLLPVFDRQFLYVDGTEVGLMNTNDEIVQELILDNTLKTPLLIELKNTVFVPELDQNQNVCSLSSLATGDVAESYSYSTYGQEQIYNSAGDELHLSALKNPWRYRCKRSEPESKLIFFDNFYYDSKLGRPITSCSNNLKGGPNAHLLANPFCVLQKGSTN